MSTNKNENSLKTSFLSTCKNRFNKKILFVSTLLDCYTYWNENGLNTGMKRPQTLE